MKNLALISAFALSLSAGAGFAQSGSQSVRVQPGFFCAFNYCMRFSDDLQKVQIQSRVKASVASYNLARNPVVSRDTLREIYRLALRQNNISSTGR